MMKKVLLIILFILVSIQSACSVRDYDLAFKLANKIMSDHARMDTEKLFYSLAQVKRSINGEVTRIIPPRYVASAMYTIVPIIAFIRLIDVRIEKCIEVELATGNGHLHRAIYIDLTSLLLRTFESDNIRQLIHFYYQSQLSICQSALPMQMDRKANEYNKNGPDGFKFNAFTNRLSNNFPQELQFNELTELQKFAAISLTISQQLTRNCLELSLINPGWRSEVRRRTALNYCKPYLFEPFGTLIRTYNIIGRYNMFRVYAKHKQIIRAYDLCKAIEELHDSDFLNILASMRTIISSLPKNEQELESESNNVIIGQSSNINCVLPNEDRQTADINQVTHRQNPSGYLERSSNELEPELDPDSNTNTTLQLGFGQN